MPGTSDEAAPAPPRFRPRRPVVVGLVGGIAAGKSAVAAAFAAHGLVHVDADRLAREVTEDPAVLAAIARELGPDLLTADGKLDRPKTAALVFADQEARRKLEALTHPAVRAAALAAIAAAKAAGNSALLDVPLLIERGLVDECDHVAFVHASDATRRARAAARGWAEGELERRERAQASLEDKRARAGFVLDNDGPLDAMRRQVADVLRRIEAGP